MQTLLCRCTVPHQVNFVSVRPCLVFELMFRCPGEVGQSCFGHGACLEITPQGSTSLTDHLGSCLCQGGYEAISSDAGKFIESCGGCKKGTYTARTEYVAPAVISCRRGGAWNKIMPNKVAATEEGVLICARECKSRSYSYFGLQCPGQSGVVCKCANSLEGSISLPDSQCNQTNVEGSTDCEGPYMAGKYMLGAQGTGSVYDLSSFNGRVTPGYYGNQTDKESRSQNQLGALECKLCPGGGTCKGTNCSSPVPGLCSASEH